MSLSGFSLPGRRAPKGRSPGAPSGAGAVRPLVRLSVGLLIFARAFASGPSALEMPPVWAGTGASSGPASPSASPDRPLLTLDQAVNLGLERNPELAKERANLARSAAYSIRAGELADPKIILGEQYFPIDFGLGESVLTMMTVGVRQSFPPWGQRSLLHQGAGLEKTASRLELDDRKARLVRDIRVVWIDLFRIRRTEAFLESVGSLWEKAFQAALARYRQGSGTESDVLSAKLRKDEIRDRRERLRLQEEESRFRLMRLMHFSRPFRISPDLPRLPAPLPESLLLERLGNHPALKSRDAGDAAQERRVLASKKNRIPAVSVEGDYSYFMGPNLITSTPNLFSVLLTFNLPVRPGERQNQETAEEEHELEAMEAAREVVRQRLVEKVRDAEGAFRQLLRRQDLFERVLLPGARRNVEAALSGYATGTLGMDRVLGAMERVGDIGIRALSIRAEILETEARLSYLAGAQTGGPHEP